LIDCALALARHHQVFRPRWLHREQDHLADVRLFCRNMDDPVIPLRKPPWGGAPYEGVNHAAGNRFSNFVLAVTRNLERLET